MSGEYRTPKRTYDHRKEFSRFKYAEEFAHRMENEGRSWIMYRGNDFTDEYGDTYPQYLVCWS